VITDSLQRPLRSLRLSVTDRCNLRCAYCMPEREYRWLPRPQILSFEEIERLVGLFQQLGVREVHVTGGEPLVRRELPGLVRRLASLGLEDLAVTTNGVLLAEQAQALRDAGLARVTVSLDTLRPERFFELSRRDELARVLAGIDAARAAGLRLKLNAVVIRGQNHDELADLVSFARERGAEVRFIEYMDVGGATGWSSNKVFDREQILAELGARLGPVSPAAGEPNAPAQGYRLADGTRFGIIASTTAPFCQSCDRSRLTADGLFYTCLYATDGLDLRDALRSGRGAEQIKELIRRRWTARDDRGAEERLKASGRAPIDREELRRDPHLEMHTRGG
jgi:cyclic pyranopterin phosphate synthase